MPEILSPIGDGYAIIGTREPDDNQITATEHLAFLIAVLKGQKVKTGAADGTDKKAMDGTRGRNLEVYLPWASYNRGSIPTGATIIVYNPRIHTEWSKSVDLYHPAPGRLTSGARALHARNFGIVAGTKAVIAFPDENGGGGTGQGIRIAKALRIPVIQGNRGSIDNVAVWLGKALQTLGFASSDLAVTLPGR